MAKTVAINLEDIHSVTDFQRNAKAHVARLRKTKAPMVLTVNGSASVVVQDAATYQELLNHVEELEYERAFVAAIHEGLKDVEEGRVYPAKEALQALGRKLGISR